MLGLLAVAATGCGTADTSYKNRDRPPAPIIVTASINKQSVSVSPSRFGAGPIKLIIANQTAASQTATLETKDSSSKTCRLSQDTGPINPRDTASLQTDACEGTYAVRVAGHAIKPAEVEVGTRRPSAQNDLLQP